MGSSIRSILLPRIFCTPPLKDDAVELTQQDDRKGFFLKHVDGKDDHLLVDENLNITSIMIW